MKNSSLEEIAKEILKDYGLIDISQTINIHSVISLMVLMSKWQEQRMYSEEEVYHILCEHTAELFKGSRVTLTEWFEKFKKK